MYNCISSFFYNCIYKNIIDCDWFLVSLFFKELVCNYMGVL